MALPGEPRGPRGPARGRQLLNRGSLCGPLQRDCWWCPGADATNPSYPLTAPESVEEGLMLL